MSARLAALWAGTLLALAPPARASEEISAVPLQPGPARPGPTRFVLLPPSRTGVHSENRYDDPRMWGDLYQESESGSLGTGVAIGDYDGDGRPDLFIVSKTGSCRLFRNLGDFRFEDVTAKAGVGDEGSAAKVWKQGATFVDVNNDGRLDLYVCRFNAPNLLYINQGDGTFKEMAHAYGLDVVDASVMASFCDYDRDGRLDLYLATNLLDSQHHPHGQHGRLFHQNASGTFTEVTAAAGVDNEAQTHSATWWDADNDGWPDLYIANDYGVPDRLYHNNHDGTFTNVIDRTLRHTSFYSMGADTGDVNNDGLIDLFVADMAATSHRGDQHSIAESRETDRDPDDPAVTPKYRRSALHLATGGGPALEGAILAGISASDWTWSVRFEDLDNDGRLDLFVTNGFNRDPDPDVHSRSMAAETVADRIRSMYNAPVLRNRHLAFRNRGDLQFEEVSAAWGLDQVGVAFGAAFGDLGGDGNLSVVYSNYNDEVSILRNTGPAGHRAEVALRGTRSNRSGVGALVRIETTAGPQVRQLWLARGYLSSSEPMVHFGLGAATRIHRLTVEWPSGATQTFRDLPGDQRYTITEPAEAPIRPPPPPAPRPALFRDVTAELGVGCPSREETVDELSGQPLLPHRLNRAGPALAVGLMADGRDALLIGGTTLDPMRILRLRGPRYERDNVALPPVEGVNDGPILLLDTQATGRLDLLASKGGNSLLDGSPEYRLRLFLGDGHGSFTAAPADSLPDLPISVGALAAADFTHCGRLGVFVGGRVQPGQYPNAARSALLRNDQGRFTDVTDQMAPALRNLGLVTAALWSDVDRDGWPDLIVALEWGGVRYFHNRAGHGFDDWSQRAGFASAGTGWWTALAAADFNGDGRMDFVVGNAGLNTPYRADPEHPATLFAGDFGGDNGPTLLEGYYEDGRLFPRRSRKTLGRALPSILRRFPTNESYARATLEDIAGGPALAAAIRYAATELRSGVFLSQPDGTYRFQPLPRLAQISPLQGIVTGDFDGDGNLDIYAVQNSYAPVPSVGRFDGGLSQLLLGDGHGGFHPLPPQESGLVVPGDAKALAIVDWNNDGWPGFFATRNNGMTIAFARALAGGAGLRLDLRGPPGNPTAVGARVTAIFADGRRVTVEVAAGSGYYSQSTASCFFPSRDGRRPARVEVRWPEGAATTHPIASGEAVQTLAHP